MALRRGSSHLHGRICLGGGMAGLYGDFGHGKTVWRFAGMKVF